MNIRTHTCGELNINSIKKTVVLNGWVNTIRLHGQVIFVDLRDNFGITQCVIENNNKYFKLLENLKSESVISVSGNVIGREKGTENKDLKTGKIEVSIESINVLSEANELPMPVFGEQDYPEDID